MRCRVRRTHREEFWMLVDSVESVLPDVRKESWESKEEENFYRKSPVWVPASDKWLRKRWGLQDSKNSCFSYCDHGPEFRAHLLRCPGSDVLKQRFK